jgi:glycosyltransferase involved in cell wall biosynthesis
MNRTEVGPAASEGTEPAAQEPPPLVIATLLREEGNTGVQTHVRQLRRYLSTNVATAPVVTPFSWSRALTVPVFGFRLLLERCSGSADVAWYRHWHEVFLRHALRRTLAGLGACTIYAQCPVSARAALRARLGPHQRVVMAVHFRISQADEWADKGRIRCGGAMFRRIRRLEQETIPAVDGLMYVSEWARSALLNWLPAAADIPSTVIDNFVTPPSPHDTDQPLIGDLVTIGHLEPVKNHRYMLDVLAAAANAGRPLTLDIFGDGPLRKDLLKQTEALGLTGQVRFRGYRSDVRDFLPRYRAYVHASYSESSSLAIIESMAAGLPIVAASIGPIAELCDDGSEARFWPLGDAAHAAKVLLTFLDDEQERSRASAAALARFSREFDASVIAPRLQIFLLGEDATRERNAHRNDQGTRSVGRPRSQR